MDGLTSHCLCVQVQPQLAGKWAPLASGFQQMWLDFWWFFSSFTIVIEHSPCIHQPCCGDPCCFGSWMEPSQDPIHFHMEIAGFTFLGALIHIIAHCVPQVFSRGPEKTSLILLSSWLRWNRLPLAKQNHTGFVFFHVFSMFFFNSPLFFKHDAVIVASFFTPGTYLWNSSSTEDATWSLATVEADQWRNGQWNDILATGWMWVAWESITTAVSTGSETPTVGELAQPLRCFIWNHPDHHDDGYWADRPLAMKFCP